jgi:hypothetical protein
MTLAELVARLGLTEVARRAGVTPATIQRWIARGPSVSGAATVAGIIKRHLAARRGMEGRRRATSFRDQLPTPPESELPEAEVKPASPPRSGSIEDRETFDYNTDRYTGEINVITVGQPALEVDFDALGTYAARIFLHSKRTFVRAKFLFFRYITPTSLGKGALIHKRGKWAEFWASTQVHSSTLGEASSFRNAVASIMDVRGEGREESLSDVAQRRILWLEQVHVHTFDDTEEPTKLATIVSRELR